MGRATNKERLRCDTMTRTNAQLVRTLGYETDYLVVDEVIGEWLQLQDADEEGYE